MATITNLFTDKETNNWFKASIALIVTKQGLTNFLDTQLQNVHAIVGRSCGNCTIEKLIPCPTNPYCNKRKPNKCPFHKSQIPQPCPTCDNVKKNIISQHRYRGPSLKNTRSEKWAHDYWEIGKCYLPPDGYSSVTSVQESDFNGVISIMLNCLHFQTRLSSSCLSPPPPDKKCPLEKVRQIGRDLRHTANGKVTDADLQDYFQTLSTLLADPNNLRHDPSATIACTRLSDLQNERMSLKEVCELLKEVLKEADQLKERCEELMEEADKRLKYAKETDKHFSKEAERTLAEALQKIESAIQAGEQRIDSKTQLGEQRIDSTTQLGAQRIESTTQAGEQRIKSTTQDGEQRIESTTQAGKQRIESTTKAGEQRLESTTHAGEKRIETKGHDVEQHIERHVQDVIVSLQQAANKTEAEDYERGVEDFRRRLIQFYTTEMNTVSVLPLNEGCDKPIWDIFVTPKLIPVSIEKDGSRKKTNSTIDQYKEIFYNNKRLKNVFIEGDPGMGKSTFLTKLAIDWCEAVSSHNSTHISTFSDVDTLKEFQLLFNISLRNANGQRDVIEIIKTQIIDFIYTGDSRQQAFKLLQQILEQETCIITMDGLNEWTDHLNQYIMPLIENCHSKCVSLVTTRPWKMTDGRIKDSKIDRLIEIEGVTDKEELTKRTILSLQTGNEKTHTEFKTYINEHQLMHFLTSPWLQVLLINVWTNNNVFKGSLCDMNCILLDLLFKKANARRDYFKSGQSIKCLLNTSFIKGNVEIFDALANAAFHLTFSSKRCLAFSAREIMIYLSEEQLQFCLHAGVLTQRRSLGIAAHDSQFSFIHETVQEFLAAYYIASSKQDLIAYFQSNTKFNVLEMSQTVIYLCGLDCVKGNNLLNSLPDVQFLNNIDNGLSVYVMGYCELESILSFQKDNYTKINNVESIQNKMSESAMPESEHCIALSILFQRMITSCYIEAKASGQKEICLTCIDFTFNKYLSNSDANALKSLLLFNKSNVRSLILESNVLQTIEILTVLRDSKRSLKRVMTTLTPEIYKALHQTSIQELHCCGKTDVSSFSRELPSMSQLTLLSIGNSSCSDAIVLPDTLKHIHLFKCTCTAVFLRRLLVHLSSVKHNIFCFLTGVTVIDCNTHWFQSELLLSDMKNITLFVKQGNTDLYGLLNGTSIAELILCGAGDCSLASEILHTLNKLTQLGLRGIYTGRCDLRMPASLQCISLWEVKCTSEWLCSLLITMSSLDRPVECELWDVVLQPWEEGLGDNSYINVSDVRSEILSRNLSNINILLANGSIEIFEIFRDTSIGILDLRTADCFSLASEILHTLNKLTKLYLWGIYTGRCDLRLPASLQCISLREFKCTSEWLCSLLITMSSLDRPVECELWDVVLQPCEEGLGDNSYINVSDVRSEILSRNLSNINILLANGSIEIFEIFRDTSIGILDLRTADCFSLASEILYSLNKLTELCLWGTYSGRCDLRLPSSLQCISLQEVKCTSEWLCSLLITMSSLDRPVNCELWDVVLQPCEEGLRDNSYINVSDVRSEILSRNLSNIKIV
ncbi:hypothetical protein DPMN_154815 [Dreissena polymorpha]|uniref:NACHT domain-containing protein n=1 Tax=Dreissena polymorpha TaxID=45954 RepID=A0A9D4JAA9_DREPO|nr:hypothetical protein DPMN_154815 [Dreissena polymorpha]